MHHLSLPTGIRLPALGLGTWRMGESRSRRAAEVAAVRTAIELGYRLIDTAEMYGEGGAEEVVGEAVAQALRAGDVAREDLFIVSKVYPHNASRTGTPAACDRSRARLGLDHIDLYLLHWRGSHPLRETCMAMQALVARGDVAHWGVSNLDIADMHELSDVLRLLGHEEDARMACAANQIYYSVGERGPEFALLPWQREQRMPVMAYSPLDQGALGSHPVLARVGTRHGATAAQVALAWVLAQPGVAAIPKTTNTERLRENLAAAQLRLSDDDLAEIHRALPGPRNKSPLAML